MSDPINTAGVIGLGVIGFDIASLYAMRDFRALVYATAKPAVGGAAGFLNLMATNDTLGDKPLTAPNLRNAMAGQKQSLYENDQAGPWLISRAK